MLFLLGVAVISFSRTEKTTGLFVDLTISSPKRRQGGKEEWLKKEFTKADWGNLILALRSWRDANPPPYDKFREVCELRFVSVTSVFPDEAALLRRWIRWKWLDAKTAACPRIFFFLITSQNQTDSLWTTYGVVTFLSCLFCVLSIPTISFMCLLYKHIFSVCFYMCVCQEAEAGLLCLLQWLSTLIFKTGSLTRKPTNSHRLVSIPFDVRVIDTGTRDLSSVLHAWAANISLTDPSPQPLLLT